MAQKEKNIPQGSFSYVLPQDINFQAIEDVSAVEFSVWVRALLQNWRQGTVGVKDRSEVSFSNKKPWKQKGTGRARAGSPRSPLWRKGGVVFGPQPRVRDLKVNKQTKVRVLNKILGDLLNSKKVLVLNTGVWEAPKTSKAFALLKDANLTMEKVLVLVNPNDFVMQASFINLPMVNVISFDQVNAFDLADAQSVVFFEKDYDLFKSMVSKWI